MPQLINVAGEVAYGWWYGPVADFGLENLQIPHPMGGQRRRFSKFWRFKRWEFFSIDVGPQLWGIAVIDLGYARAFFMYLHAKEQRQTQSDSRRIPLLPGAILAVAHTDGASSGRTRFLSGRFNPGFSLQVQYTPQQCHLSVENRSLQLRAELCLQRVQPLSLCLPTGADGWTYTCKETTMPVQGWYEHQGQRFSVQDGLASLDLSLGLLRRETSWQWCSLMGVVNQQRIGVNLALGVNESGQTENALWVDGQLYKLPAVSFHPRPGGCLIRGDGVQLEFTGDADHGEKLNIGLLASRFRQYQGRYSGALRGGNAADAGPWITLEGISGLWEDHYVRW